MLDKIDLDKTIASNRIKFKTSRILKIWGNINYVLVISILSALSIYSGYELFRIEIITEKLFEFIFMLLLTIAMIAGFNYKLYGSNKIKRVSGIEIKEILEAIKELKWEILSKNQEYLIISPGIRNRQITVVFDQNDILIHSLRFGRGNGYFRNTSKIVLFLNKIKEIQNKNAVQHHV